MTMELAKHSQALNRLATLVVLGGGGWFRTTETRLALRSLYEKGEGVVL